MITIIIIIISPFPSNYGLLAFNFFLEAAAVVELWPEERRVPAISQPQQQQQKQLLLLALPQVPQPRTTSYNFNNEKKRKERKNRKKREKIVLWESVQEFLNAASETNLMVILLTISQLIPF